MERVTPCSRQEWDRTVHRAVQVLGAGGVVAAPTETVYGLLAAWDDDRALRRIYEIKKRSEEKPLQMLAPTLGAALRAGLLPDPRLSAIASEYWPGPLTVVAPGRDGVELGVRVPDHDFVRGVLHGLGAPLAATSANRSGRPPAVTADEAIAGLLGEPDMLVDGGRVSEGVASTVIRLLTSGFVVLRVGPISAESIRAVLT